MASIKALGLCAEDDLECLECIEEDGWRLADPDPKQQSDGGLWLAHEYYPYEVQIVPNLDPRIDELKGRPLAYDTRRAPWLEGHLPSGAHEPAVASARAAAKAILQKLPETLIDRYGFVIGAPVGGRGRPPTVDECFLVAVTHVLAHRPDHRFHFERGNALKHLRKAILAELANEDGTLTDAGEAKLGEMLEVEPCFDPSEAARRHCSVCLLGDAGLHPLVG